MARTRTAADYERELFDFVQRSLSEPRDFVELESEEEWQAYAEDLIGAETGYPPTDAQLGWLTGAPELLERSLRDVGLSFERGVGFGGVPFARFRDDRTGRFVGFRSMLDTLSGYFYLIE